MKRSLLISAALTMLVVIAALLAAALAAGFMFGPGAAESAFPGTNGKMAFDSTRDGNRAIYVMNADGTGVTRLTNNAAADSWPAWAPDRSKIAFVSDRDAPGVRREIYVMDADGSGQTRLTNSTGTSDNYCPSWSPDGTKILWVSAGAGLSVMNADGTGQTVLATGGSCGDWSPDGSKIAFTTYDLDIYVMNPDGTGQTPLITGPGIASNPAWSPDGTKIAFDSDRDAGQYNMDIYVANADGTGVVRLTTTPTAPGDCVPDWSPDGLKIAFQGARPGPNSDIYIINADGTGETNVTNNPADDTDVAWQPILALSVGGIAEAPLAGAEPLADEDISSGPNAPALAGLATCATLLLAAGGWHARRRWLR